LLYTTFVNANNTATTEQRMVAFHSGTKAIGGLLTNLPEPQNLAPTAKKMLY
jgi:hypothetical protein|tara:strand:+ start:12 stop:167 length:156 start_codon:yes stop_codon:yes gene_type:complete